MNVRKSLLLVVSAATLASGVAFADRDREPNPPRYPGDNSPPLRPGEPPRFGEPPRRPEPPRQPEPPRRPEPPQRPQPPYRPEPPRERPPYRPEPPRHEPPIYRPEPPRQDPGMPPSRPGYGELRRRVSINRYVTNESLSIGYLAGIDNRYNGSQLLGVEVEFDNGYYANAELVLKLNGMVESTARVNDNYTVLRPVRRAQIGYDVRSIDLDVHGQVGIRSITVVLSDNGNYQPDPGVYRLTINVMRRTGANDRIDLNQYVDARNFYGYRVESMTVSARAVGNGGLIDVIVGNANQSTISLDPYLRDYQVQLYNYPMLGVDRFTLETRGLIEVNQVNLVLTRRGR